MNPVTASAPGSVMVIGEHAVVLGAPSLVAAIDQRAQVTVEPLEGDRVEIVSEIAAPLEARLGALPSLGPYSYLTAAIKKLGVDRGIRITTKSQIDPTMGLGSSAAVSIAAIGAMARAFGRDIDIHQTALSIVRDVQGRGSGADLAGSLHGGLVGYQLEEAAGTVARFDVMPAPPELSLKYVGYKTKTGEVLEKVAWAASKEPRYYARVYEEMRLCAEAGIQSAKAKHWAALAAHLDAYQGLMVALGVSDENLEELVLAARMKGAMAAKISGSGLGDCVLAFGSVPDGFSPAALATEGLVFHD